MKEIDGEADCPKGKSNYESNGNVGEEVKGEDGKNEGQTDGEKVKQGQEKTEGQTDGEKAQRTLKIMEMIVRK